MGRDLCQSVLGVVSSGPIGVTDVADRVRLPKSTVARLLASLVREAIPYVADRRAREDAARHAREDAHRQERHVVDHEGVQEERDGHDAGADQENAPPPDAAAWNWKPCVLHLW